MQALAPGYLVLPFDVSPAARIVVVHLFGMSGGLGVLSMAWISVEASMSLGWRLMALVRDADSDDWLATAARPLDCQTVYGRGAQPDRALRRLAEELRRMKGPMTG